jgi:6-pyruvoyltetrahydropterin/6-carboxytetrahydropterin synthase
LIVFEVGLSTTFKAWHVMPGMEGPEGELHEHNYRLEVVAARRALDERGMVCDLDALEKAMLDTVGLVEGKDLEIIRPPEREAVTVEVLACWSHAEVVGRLGTGGIEMLSVRVWESPVAFGGYSASPDS